MAKLFGVERGTLYEKARAGVDVLVDEHELAYIRYLMQMEEDMAPGRKTEVYATPKRSVASDYAATDIAFYLNGQPFPAYFETPWLDYATVSQLVLGKQSDSVLTVIYAFRNADGAHWDGSLAPGQSVAFPQGVTELRVNAVVTNRA